MKLIVGLGNPGRRYAYSRHNVGFLVLEKLAKSLGLKSFKEESKFKAELLNLRPAPYALPPLLLAKPTTFMNESGQAVKAIAVFYEIKPRDILVISDDADMVFGKLRLRPKGSSGGHRGLKSIIEALGTEQFPRLKIGMGRDKRRDLDDYLLSNFTPEQKKKLPRILAEAVEEIIQKWLTER